VRRSRIPRHRLEASGSARARIRGADCDRASTMSREARCRRARAALRGSQHACDRRSCVRGSSRRLVAGDLPIDVNCESRSRGDAEEPARARLAPGAPEITDGRLPVSAGDRIHHVEARRRR
jgi:hypothetical protein